MKKKEMAALFDDLAGCAMKTRVVTVGKQSGRVDQAAIEIALVAMAITFAFCADVSADVVNEPLGGIGEEGRRKTIGCILETALKVDAEDAK